jgi:transcriptional regulator with XRE-family HTH domain
VDQAKLLDAVLRRLNLPSDYALAKLWGLSPAHISQYRSGKHRFDDYALNRVAEALDKDPRELIAQRELSKNPTGERRAYWETLLKKRRGAASAGAYTVACIATSAIIGMLTAPNAAAETTDEPPTTSELATNYTQYRRRALMALRVLLSLVPQLPHPLRYTTPSGV